MEGYPGDQSRSILSSPVVSEAEEGIWRGCVCGESEEEEEEESRS